MHPPALEAIYRTLKLYQLFREFGPRASRKSLVFHGFLRISLHSRDFTNIHNNPKETHSFQGPRTPPGPPGTRLPLVHATTISRKVVHEKAFVS